MSEIGDRHDFINRGIERIRGASNGSLFVSRRRDDERAEASAPDLESADRADGLNARSDGGERGGRGPTLPAVVDDCRSVPRRRRLDHSLESIRYPDLLRICRRGISLVRKHDHALVRCARDVELVVSRRPDNARDGRAVPLVDGIVQRGVENARRREVLVADEKSAVDDAHPHAFAPLIEVVPSPFDVHPVQAEASRTRRDAPWKEGLLLGVARVVHREGCPCRSDAAGEERDSADPPGIPVHRESPRELWRRHGDRVIIGS